MNSVPAQNTAQDLARAELARAEIAQRLGEMQALRSKRLTPARRAESAVNVPQLAARFGLPAGIVNQLRIAEEDARGCLDPLD